MRYWMFCQKGPKSESLPPTSDCIRLHIQRANYQCVVWEIPLCTMQNFTPIGHGWKLCNTGDIAPLLMTKDTAPSRLVEFSSCRCQKSACLKNVFAQVTLTESPVQRPAHVWQMTTSVKTHIKIP